VQRQQRSPFEIRSLDCVHCRFAVDPKNHRHSGDPSGSSRYNRARAVIVKHLYEQHRNVMTGNCQPPNSG
jgi:hypothetical protein